MRNRLLSTGIVIGFLCFISAAQSSPDSAKEIGKLAEALGATNLKTIEYSGSGYSFAVGQSVSPTEPWPKFNLTSYKRVIDYQAVASREETVLTQGENPPRGGGAQPVIGERRQTALVRGGKAWNAAGTNAVPAPATLGERLLQIWLTPHGFATAAAANSATVSSRVIGGKKTTVISFSGHGKYKINGYLNSDGLLQRVETWLPNPVLGDMLIEAQYSDYRDFNGVKFPTRILQKHGGHPALDLTVSAVRPNATASIDIPDNVKNAVPAAVRVDAQQLADGVWYLAGGTHHSVAIEFKPYIVVIEGPANEERSDAVIAAVKKLVPNKPIRYLVNTHHHFDHSGGLRTYAAEGATILTHKENRLYYLNAAKAPRSLSPDKLAQSKRPLVVEPLGAKRVLTDGVRTLELHHVAGSTHNRGLIMAHLPKEKILIEADAYTPPAAGTPPPATPSPFTVNLYENIVRLKLDVARIAPLHGRVVAFDELLKAVGKGA